MRKTTIVTVFLFGLAAGGLIVVLSMKGYLARPAGSLAILRQVSSGAAVPARLTASVSAKGSAIAARTVPPEAGGTSAPGCKREEPSRQPGSKPGPAAKTRRSGSNFFVPPPPPTIPAAPGMGGASGVPASLLSKSDLAKRQKELTGMLVAAHGDVEAKEKDADSKRQRSTLFASLYTEGVVSRHELEICQHEDKDAVAELRTAHQKADQLQSDLTETEACLSKLAKSAKPKTHDVTGGKN